jgi:hypothetical protein
MKIRAIKRSKLLKEVFIQQHRDSQLINGIIIVVSRSSLVTIETMTVVDTRCTEIFGTDLILLITRPPRYTHTLRPLFKPLVIR